MPEPDTVLPIVQETASIRKLSRETGRVRIETVTETVERIIKTDLDFTTVSIDRVPIDREVDSLPEIRTEGDTTIIPVIEERLVLEKRLVLKEEIRITHHHATKTVETPIALRGQRAIVSRDDLTLSPPMETPMSNLTNTRHLTAFFDSRADADEALDRLRTLGISDADMRVSGGEDATSRLATEDTGGFWSSVSNFFFPSEDRETYAEGLRRGGYLLTVSNVPEARYDDAVDILDDEGSIDLEERSASWRAEGWNDASTERGDLSTAGGADPSLTAPVGTGADLATPAAILARDDALLAGDLGGAEDRGTDEVIPVVQENLRVGKRDVDLGRVRVRSYLVETPVSEDVALRRDTVEIERRPVDRPLGATDTAFTDRVIEATERAEEAVVEKEARIVEEIALRKTSDTRTETISDTVRHTEVEIEDDRDALNRDPKTRGL